MKVILKNFRLVDEETDALGSIIVQDGIITALQAGNPLSTEDEDGAAMIIDGENFLSSGKPPVLMPAFVDLHAHFRDPGIPSIPAPPSVVELPSEVIESACMAAAAGGFGAVVCMANTKPAIDTIEKAESLKKRSDALGLIDLFPVISLTKNMEGKELSEITGVSDGAPYIPLMFSEDGKDLEDNNLFLAAMKEAKRIGVPISCHCDFGGDENNAVRRIIALGKQAGCRIHIAHVSTKEAVHAIRAAKQEIAANKAQDGFALSCEAMPHHLCLTEEDANKLGAKTWGKVSPPLRSEEDRQALIQALKDGTIDAIATDHAPHSAADKESGSPGFSGFETAFAALYTEHIRGGNIDLKRLSSLLSASPARLLGFESSLKPGRFLPGCTADLVILDTEATWIVEPEKLFSRGKNSPFLGRQLYGKILMTLHRGRVVFQSSKKRNS
jgi:Dihydroorotase and related cyclic amidohydrolases